MTTTGDHFKLRLLQKCLDDPACAGRNEAMLRALLAEIDAELARRKAEGRQ